MINIFNQHSTIVCFIQRIYLDAADSICRKVFVITGVVSLAIILTVRVSLFSMLKIPSVLSYSPQLAVLLTSETYSEKPFCDFDVACIVGTIIMNCNDICDFITDSSEVVLRVLLTPKSTVKTVAILSILYIY